MITELNKIYKMQQKTVHLGKFITLNAYFTKEERFKFNDLSFHFGKLEKNKNKKNKLNLK